MASGGTRHIIADIGHHHRRDATKTIYERRRRTTHPRINETAHVAQRRRVSYDRISYTLASRRRDLPSPIGQGFVRLGKVYLLLCRMIIFIVQRQSCVLLGLVIGRQVRLTL